MPQRGNVGQHVVAGIEREQVGQALNGRQISNVIPGYVQSFEPFKIGDKTEICDRVAPQAQRFQLRQAG